MKLFNIYKTIAILSLLNASTNLMASTDWNQLIEEMPNIKIETVQVDPKGYVRMEIAKRPNGKLRFVGFRSYLNSTKMILNIHSKTKDLEKICGNYVTFRKSFKAELIFNISPISESFNFITSNGENASTSDFENPFIIGEAVVEPLPNTTQTSFTFNSSDYLKFKNYNINQGVPDLLNSAIKNRNSDTITVDLTNYGGVACDLAFGNIRPVINKSISYEKALPNKSLNWISKDSFSDIFKNFWLDHSKLVNDENKVDQKSSELILLGMKVANVDIVKKHIFEDENRALKLFKAIKFNSDSLNGVDVRTVNPEEQWQHTFDYLIPESTQINSSVMIQREAVYASIVD